MAQQPGILTCRYRSLLFLDGQRAHLWLVPGPPGPRWHWHGPRGRCGLFRRSVIGLFFFFFSFLSATYIFLFILLYYFINLCLLAARAPSAWRVDPPSPLRWLWIFFLVHAARLVSRRRGWPGWRAAWEGGCCLNCIAVKNDGGRSCRWAARQPPSPDSQLRHPFMINDLFTCRKVVVECLFRKLFAREERPLQNEHSSSQTRL